MSNIEFNEKALYQFTLDVNEFGPQVAAELLIKLMKVRASEINVKTAPKIYPPDNYSICSQTGSDHMWGGAHCRHCDMPWPDEYK